LQDVGQAGTVLVGRRDAGEIEQLDPGRRVLFRLVVIAQPLEARVAHFHRADSRLRRVLAVVDSLESLREEVEDRRLAAAGQTNDSDLHFLYES
jgi:hypothetical protein